MNEYAVIYLSSDGRYFVQWAATVKEAADRRRAYLEDFGDEGQAQAWVVYCPPGLLTIGDEVQPIGKGGL